MTGVLPSTEDEHISMDNIHWIYYIKIYENFFYTHDEYTGNIPETERQREHAEIVHKLQDTHTVCSSAEQFWKVKKNSFSSLIHVCHHY